LKRWDRKFGVREAPRLLAFLMFNNLHLYSSTQNAGIEIVVGYFLHLGLYYRLDFRPILVSIAAYFLVNCFDGLRWWYINYLRWRLGPHATELRPWILYLWGSSMGDCFWKRLTAKLMGTVSATSLAEAWHWLPYFLPVPYRLLLENWTLKDVEEHEKAVINSFFRKTLLIIFQ
jgi:hypothetical protein